VRTPAPQPGLASRVNRRVADPSRARADRGAEAIPKERGALDRPSSRSNFRSRLGRRSPSNTRLPHTPVPGSRASDLQFDLWPQRIAVEELDVKAIAGERTRVKAMYRVRYERDGGTHQVFFDHHGWYCAEHGKACPAVREVTVRRHQEGAS